MNHKERCKYLEERIKRLNLIGIALSSEDDINVLFEMIMDEAKHIANADGRTLYMISEDGQTMKFEILRTDSMNFAQGGTTGVDITFPPMQLFDDDGNPTVDAAIAREAR